MDITEAYFDTLTITATDGFTPNNVRLIVQVNPSVEASGTGSVTMTVGQNTTNFKKVNLAQFFTGGSDSLLYTIADTSTTGQVLNDDDDAAFGTTFGDLISDDTLRIYPIATNDSVFTDTIRVRAYDSNGTTDTTTLFISTIAAQAFSASDSIPNFGLTRGGNDTTVSAAAWSGGFGDLTIALSANTDNFITLDTLENGEFKLTPDSVGSTILTYSATDENNVVDTRTFTVTVNDSISSTDIADFTRVAADGDTTFNLMNVFAGGDRNYSYSTSFSKAKVASATIVEDTLTISPLDSGVTTLTLTASDGQGGSHSFETVITVTGTTFTPSFDSALSEIDTTLIEGQAFEFTYIASSTNEDATYKYKFTSTAPSGATLDSTTGKLTWTPASSGDYTISVQAIDNDDATLTATDNATITVTTAPTFSAALSDTSVATGDTLEFTFVADVYEGGSVASYTVDSSYASTASITSAGVFTFIPGVTYNGDYDFTVTAADDRGTEVSTSFTVNVTQTQPWGDVSGNGALTANDASALLRHVVGLDTLQGDTLTLADVSGNGSVSSYDASLILRKVADPDFDFPVERAGNAKEVAATGEFALANMSGAAENELALKLSVDQTSGVNALTITINYDAGLNELTAIESSLPDGWMFFYNDIQEEGQIKISAAGTTELVDRDNLITLRFNTMNVEMPSSVNADVTMNEANASPLADVLLQAIPSEFTLNQNYPNPFNPTTNIKFALPQSSIVKLEVFNVLGQRVATLVNGEMNAGYHTVMFDASNLASGVYVYRINTGEHMQVKRMMLIK